MLRCWPHRQGVVPGATCPVHGFSVALLTMRVWHRTVHPHRQCMDHQGWHGRGYLPHLDQPGLTQFVTFRLADAGQLAGARLPPQHEVEWQRMDDELDLGQGRCHLKDPRHADLVVEALRCFDGVRYRLRAWVVMPNHVHVLMDQVRGHPLGQVVGSWKSWAARNINADAGRAGRLWQPDYFDRFMRDEGDVARTVAYIHWNPVKAGLVDSANQWRWSSAWEGGG